MGAQGLGQLMPDAARKYRVKDPLDPAQSIFGSAAYLSDLINTFRGDLVLALAAYSAGLEAVKGYGGVPPFGGSRAFVPKVLSAFAIAGTFCTKPPDAARRKCELK